MFVSLGKDMCVCQKSNNRMNIVRSEEEEEMLDRELLSHQILSGHAHSR